MIPYLYEPAGKAMYPIALVKVARSDIPTGNQLIVLPASKKSFVDFCFLYR
jgi:hypothetical protein